MDVRLCRILKVGKYQYMDLFFNKGEMYFGTVESFNKMDANQELFDNHEGATDIEQIDWLKIQLTDGKTIEFSKNDPNLIKLSSAYKLTHDSSKKGNIYSCTVISPETIDDFKKLDQRFKKFGDVVICIEKPEIFLDRVKKGLNNKNYKYEMYLVTYYDPNNYNGELNVFKKKNLHSYQNEMRIWIENSDGNPIKIQIGSIKDIAFRSRMEIFK